MEQSIVIGIIALISAIVGSLISPVVVKIVDRVLNKRTIELGHKEKEFDLAAQLRDELRTDLLSLRAENTRLSEIIAEQAAQLRIVEKRLDEHQQEFQMEKEEFVEMIEQMNLLKAENVQLKKRVRLLEIENSNLKEANNR